MQNTLAFGTAWGDSRMLGHQHAMVREKNISFSPFSYNGDWCLAGKQHHLGAKKRLRKHKHVGMQLGDSDRL